MLLSMTHEEAVTDLARYVLSSYQDNHRKTLPPGRRAEVQKAGGESCIVDLENLKEKIVKIKQELFKKLD